MPTKEDFTPIGKLYLKDENGNIHVVDDMKIVDIETVEDNSDSIAVSLCKANELINEFAISLSKSAMSSLTHKLALIFSNNRRRLHGQKPFRPRTYWKCVKYEIHRRTFGQISTGNSD